MTFVGFIRGNYSEGVTELSVDLVKHYGGIIKGAVWTVPHESEKFGEFMHEINPNDWIYTIRK